MTGRANPDLFGAVEVLRVLGYSEVEIIRHDGMKVVCSDPAVQASFEDIGPSVSYYISEVEDPKRLDLLRIDKTIKEVMDILTGEGKTSRLMAARTMVNLLDRRSKLLGLDAPIKVDQTTKELGYYLEGVDMKEITEGLG